MVTVDVVGTITAKPLARPWLRKTSGRGKDKQQQCQQKSHKTSSFEDSVIQNYGSIQCRNGVDDESDGAGCDVLGADAEVTGIGAIADSPEDLIGGGNHRVGE